MADTTNNNNNNNNSQQNSNEEMESIEQKKAVGYVEEDILKKEPIRKGLSNVVFDTTKISFTNGTTGTCSYRGYLLDDLFMKSSFEEVCFLLIFGHLPSSFEFHSFCENLAKEREIPDRVLMILKSFPRNTTRIELMRTAVSALSLYDVDDYDYSLEGNIRKSIRIISKIATILAYSHRIQENLPLIEPTKHLGHAANFYYMLSGEEPSEKVASIFDRLLICHAEHTANASTFAARVTVSTLSDLYSGVISAIGTLRGPLHGGANERVIEYMLEFKSIDEVIPWAKEKFAKKEKISGFGHRVYRTYDPRGKLMKPFAKALWDDLMKEDPSRLNLLEVSNLLEDFVIKEKGIYPNVDYTSAIIMYAIGINPRLFTPLFAVSRCAGWLAHALDQLEHNKMLRPRLRYIGEYPKEYKKIDDR